MDEIYSQMVDSLTTMRLSPFGSGSGSALPFPVLLSAGLCTIFAVLVSAMSIFLHLKNYRKPMLQRMVIRIMLMVPIYAISSLISLFSLNAAFFIDVVRDIYEAFVIYCFFNLLLGYLGGERSLLILLHGREPKHSVFPMSLFKKEIDVSDPYFFLFLKRGIIQYVEVKPILAILTLILKVTGKYNDGDLKANSGFLYISVVYNISICLSLYCLALFWMCINEDLKPFRPMPKFICVKGILFFSFWQSIVISIFVAAGLIRQLGPYTDEEHISIGLSDTLICFEMPIFAIAHMYAFSHTDYVDRSLMYAARMPMYFAMRDAFGFKDVIEDSKATLRGEGINYREFEPAEGFIHQGSGRERRIQAGLRYSKGGQKKYWLPMPADVTERDGTSSRAVHLAGVKEDDVDVYAPLLEDQAAAVVHNARDIRSAAEERTFAEREGFELSFGDLDDEDELLYEHSRNYLFGDYLYPCVDVSSEFARQKMWEEEERILHDERGAYFSPIRGAEGLLAAERHPVGYGAVNIHTPSISRHSSNSNSSGSGVAKGKGKVHYNDNRVAWRDDGRVIDKIDNVAPGLDDGLRLGWTRDVRRLDNPRQPQPPSPSSSASPYQRSRTLSSSAEGSSAGSPAKGMRAKKIATDAVDLVVENDKLAEEEMIHERQRGEPAVRGTGWRKAFTQGHFIPDQKVEEEGLEDVKGVEPTSEVAGNPETLRKDTVIEEGGLEIAQATTPPPHAQANLPGRDLFPPHEENPWG